MRHQRREDPTVGGEGAALDVLGAECRGFAVERATEIFEFAPDGGHTMSSAVPAAHRYLTLTGFFCPMRCARSSAWSIAEGTQCSSPNTTSDAAVSVSPCPHAWMLSTATRSAESS